MIDWRKFGDDAHARGDADEVDRWFHEARDWDKTVRDLHRALRHVALASS